MRSYPGAGALTAGLISVGLLAFVPAGAHAAAYLPPPDRSFFGVTGSKSVELFGRQTGKHPAVFGFFTQWNSPWEYIFRSAESARSRLMIHISTAQGYGARERITPRGIALGNGDRYLVALNQRIAESGGIAYVRFLAEMNQANNAYSGFGHDGRSRGRSHSPATFKQAFRRATLILRGGPARRVNARLRSLGLPRINGVSPTGTLPRPKVAMQWVPQVAGTPNIPANMPRAYWPGSRYVDWVGTDFYSKFPNFRGLERFYEEFGGKPFVFGEWAIWGADEPGFARRLFAWIRSHRRVRMAVYNQGQIPNGPFRLKRHPASRRAIRAELRSRRWAGFAPEFAP